MSSLISLKKSAEKKPNSEHDTNGAAQTAPFFNRLSHPTGEPIANPFIR
jgi:hypothetical protein